MRFHNLIRVFCVAFFAFLVLIKGDFDDERKYLDNENNPVKKEFEKFKEECMSKHKTSMLQLAFIFVDSYDPNAQPNPYSRPGRCWIDCMFQKFNVSVVKNLGKGKQAVVLNKEVVKQRAKSLSPDTQNRLNRNFGKCAEKYGKINDTCEMSFAFAKCMYDAYKERKLQTAKRQGE